MESLLSHSQSTLAFGQNSPLAVAQRFSFLNHCLSCNVLCKACVLREGEEEQLAAMKAEQEEAALMGSPCHRAHYGRRRSTRECRTRCATRR